MLIRTSCLLLMLSLWPLTAQTAAPETGPVIEHFGPVYAVPADSLNLQKNKTYKVILDIGEGPQDPAEKNRNIETAARFINMHARNGIDPAKLQLALVLHGGGTHSAMNQAAQESRGHETNGSEGLIAALLGAGVKIYVCGQSAAHHGYGQKDLLPGVEMAVSAMTAHIRLQDEGYLPVLF